MLESVYGGDTGMREGRGLEWTPGHVKSPQAPPKIGATSPEGGHLQSFYISLLFFTSFDALSV